LEGGNTHLYFYVENPQESLKPHNIDAGGALRHATLRPAMTVQAPLAHRSVFEMTTRVGVGFKEILEDREAKVIALNDSKGAVRVLGVPGAGDWEYIGFLKCSNDPRLTEGDHLLLNFRISDPIEEEDRRFRVLAPFTWVAEGEIVELLKLPRQPARANATVEEKNRYQPFQTTKLPYTTSLARTSDEAHREVSADCLCCQLSPIKQG
jgi:hypothetical protein